MNILPERDTGPGQDERIPADDDGKKTGVIAKNDSHDNETNQTDGNQTETNERNIRQHKHDNLHRL
jgi:hypothetical protein